MRKLKPGPLVRRLRRPGVLYLMRGETRPLSEDYGRERGTPVDRYFIEQFLYANRAAIRGRCLEVGSDRYITRFGEERVTQTDVLDIDAANERATIVGDLQDLESVPDSVFDCVILTQVLQYIEDPGAALAEVARIMTPAATMLATVPSLARVDPFVDPGTDYWRFTQASARLLVDRHFSSSEIGTWGNARVGVAYWVGMAAEDLRLSTLERHDSRFPCGVTMRCRKQRDDAVA